VKNRLYQNKEWLEKKYCEEKLSVAEIAEICRATTPTVYTWIENFNLTREYVLPRRSKSRYSLNERYFEK